MNIKELLKRNTPVFFIGLATFIIFIIIIATSQLRKPVEPTLIKTEESELVASHTNTVGSRSAPLLVVMFSDFTCSVCPNYKDIMNELVQTYPEYIMMAMRHFPSEENERSFEAAQAAQAAGKQGRFWEYVDVLFRNQDKFREGDFVRYADILNLDLKQFRADLYDEGIKNQIFLDRTYGENLGVIDTPTFFINGEQIIVKTPQDLKVQIEDELERIGINIAQIKNEAEVKQREQENQAYIDIYNTIDQRLGIKEIQFVDGNFDPRNTSATAGQLVRYVNNSDETIKIIQIMDKYEALSRGVSLKPGESFEFRLELRRYGLWTYRNEGNPIRASIMVGKLPKDLMELLPQEEI